MLALSTGHGETADVSGLESRGARSVEFTWYRSGFNSRRIVSVIWAFVRSVVAMRHIFRRSILVSTAPHRSRRLNDVTNTSSGCCQGSSIARVEDGTGSRSPATIIRSAGTPTKRAIWRACRASITTTRSALRVVAGTNGRERNDERSKPRCALTAIAKSGTDRPGPTKPAEETRMSGSARVNTASRYGLRHTFP